MPALTRVLQKIFGSTPPGSDQFGKIGSIAAGTPEYTTDPLLMQSLSNYEGGLYSILLGNNSPATQDFNSLFYLITRQLAYLFERGVPEWSSTTTYYIDSVVNVSGTLYKSLTDTNLNNNPSTSITNWTLINPIQKIQYSNWSRKEAFATSVNRWSTIRFLNNTFFAITNEAANDVFAISDNGSSFYEKTFADSTNWGDIAYGNSVYVAVGYSEVNSSSDGISWTSRTPSSANQWKCVAYGASLFAALGNSGKVMTSPDGITWTDRTDIAGTFSPDNIIFENSIFVAVGRQSSNNTNKVATSSDGITWTIRSVSGVTTTASLTQISYGNGLFITVSNLGEIFTSSDAITWTSQTVPSLVDSFGSIIFTGVSYGNGYFAIVGYINSSGSVVLISQDGITWTSVGGDGIGEINKMAFGKGVFVAGTGGGSTEILTSLKVPE